MILRIVKMSFQTEKVHEFTEMPGCSHLELSSFTQLQPPQ